MTRWFTSEERKALAEVLERRTARRGGCLEWQGATTTRGRGRNRRERGAA